MAVVGGARHIFLSTGPLPPHHSSHLEGHHSHRRLSWWFPAALLCHHERYPAGRQQALKVITWSLRPITGFGSSVFFQTTSNSPTSRSTASILHARTLRPAPVCLGQLVCVNRSPPSQQGKAHTLGPGIYHRRPSANSPQPPNKRRRTDGRQADDRAALVAQNHTASYHPPDDPGRPARTRPSARLCRAQSRPDRLWVCLRGCVGVTCRPAAAGISRVPGQPILKSREPLSSRCAVQGPKSPTELPSTPSIPPLD